MSRRSTPRSPSSPTLTALALTALLALVGCSGGSAPTTPVHQAQRASGSLPEVVETQIRDAMENWNFYYGTHVQATGFTYLGVIRNSKDLGRAKAFLSDPAKTWFPSGDIAFPDDMTALPISEATDVLPAQLAAYRAEVAGKVALGQHAVRVEWTRDGERFISLLLTTDSGFVYDTMFFNMVLTDSRGGAATRDVFDYRMWWIWEKSRGWEHWTRGQITASVTAECIPTQQGTIVVCTEKCEATMTLGSAEIKGKAEPVAGTNCCKLTYTWAWKTSLLQSIEVGADGFTLGVKGELGSSGSGNGSAIVCCNE